MRVTCLEYFVTHSDSDTILRAHVLRQLIAVVETIRRERAPQLCDSSRPLRPADRRHAGLLRVDQRAGHLAEQPVFRLRADLQ